MVESAVDEIGVQLSAPRAAHQREGHERFTLNAIVEEEAAVLDIVEARDDRAQLWIKDDDTAALSSDQKRAVENIGRSPWLVQPLSAPAGAGKTTSMRALVKAAHRRHGGTVLVLAPTGKAVDVAVREGAGDTGLTIAKALQLVRDNRLELRPHTLVIVDEAAMVGTGDLRRLLSTTTSAGAKTVLVGDAHQLAPVKARGGMFAQLCTDLPWTQHLSEVWRMRDPDERSASLALRHGGPVSVRRAIGWYRTHHRLRTGDPVSIAADALAAHRADTAAGKDALLVCDTTEMADALNQRLHYDTVNAGASTVAAARGQRIAVGDLMISRRNDPSITVQTDKNAGGRVDTVRNGQRWRVAAIDTATNRLAAQRLDDGARAVFGGPYLREHVGLGYAVTVHASQGVTVGSTHAVVAETTTRSLFYVAMTRGRQANTAYLCQRTPEPDDHVVVTDGAHVAVRGSGRDAARVARAILARNDMPGTAHQVAANTVPQRLPDPVARLVNRRSAALSRRRATHRAWRTASTVQARAADRSHIRGRSRDYGLEL
jgi:hypothetical protein